MSPGINYEAAKARNGKELQEDSPHSWESQRPFLSFLTRNIEARQEVLRIMGKMISSGTILADSNKTVVAVVLPADDVEKIADDGRELAAEDRVVAEDDEGVASLDHVVLDDHCRRKGRRRPRRAKHKFIRTFDTRLHRPFQASSSRQ